jgi:hypothetical protein
MTWENIAYVQADRWSKGKGYHGILLCLLSIKKAVP